MLPYIREWDNHIYTYCREHSENKGVCRIKNAAHLLLSLQGGPVRVQGSTGTGLRRVLVCLILTRSLYSSAIDRKSQHHFPLLIYTLHTPIRFSASLLPYIHELTVSQSKKHLLDFCHTLHNFHLSAAHICPVIG
jgi:hypothetical protein